MSACAHCYRLGMQSTSDPRSVSTDSRRIASVWVMNEEDLLLFSLQTATFDAKQRLHRARRRSIYAVSFPRHDISLSFWLWIPHAGEGSATRVLLLQSSRSSTSTGVRLGWWDLVRWCLSISSSVPLPSPIPTSIILQLRGYAWRSRSGRWTCPYHLSLDSHILSVMQQTPMAWRMSSFLFLSFSVIPSVHQSIRWMHSRHNISYTKSRLTVHLSDIFRRFTFYSMQHNGWIWRTSRRRYNVGLKYKVNITVK